MGELARVCAPGGTVIVVTWCHRVLAAGEALRCGGHVDGSVDQLSLGNNHLYLH